MRSLAKKILLILPFCLLIVAIIRFPQTIQAGCEKTTLCGANGMSVCYSCKSGCDDCDSNNERECCNGGSPPCGGGLDDCGPGDPGYHPPKPWDVKGSKVLYKNAGNLNDVRSSQIKIESADGDLRATTTGGNDFNYLMNRIYRVSNGQELEIKDITVTASVTPPAGWDAYATYCRNSTDCHDSGDRKYTYPTDIRLGFEGGFLDLFWHFIAPPSNLQVTCNAPGTQATLSWTNGPEISSHRLYVANESDSLPNDCNPDATGPAGVCRTINGANSFTMNTTPLHYYSWFVNTEDKNAYIVGPVFRCGPPPTGYLFFGDSTCVAEPGHYEVGEDFYISHYSTAETGLGSTTLYVAKVCNNNSLCEYTSQPSWCGGNDRMKFGSNGRGSFCEIEKVTYGGATNSSNGGYIYTPVEPGEYYAVINVTSENAGVFQCSSNPMCEYSASTLTKYPGTACADGRFSPCQTGVLANRIGDPENFIMRGEAVRFVVDDSDSCDLRPVCGIIRGRNHDHETNTVTYTPLWLEPVQLLIDGIETNVTSSDQDNPATGNYIGRFSYLSSTSLPGSAYSVKLRKNELYADTDQRAAPMVLGYFPPGKTNSSQESYSNQEIRGTNDCAKNCPINPAEKPASFFDTLQACDFTYESCNQVNPIVLDPNNKIVFDRGTTHDFLTNYSIGWTQSRATTGWSPEALSGENTITYSTKYSIEINVNDGNNAHRHVITNPALSSSPEPGKVHCSSTSPWRCTYTLSQFDLGMLYQYIEGNAFPSFTIIVNGNGNLNNFCANQGAGTYTSATDTSVVAEEKLIIRVKTTTSSTSCDPSSVLTTTDKSDLPDGRISAVFPSASGGPLVHVGDAGDLENYSITTKPNAMVRTGVRFSSPLFVCPYSNSPLCEGASADVWNAPSDPESGQTWCRRQITADQNTEPGYIDIYITRINVPSWWSAVGGLVYGKSAIGSNLPVSSSTNLPLFCASDPKCSPLLLRSPSYVSNPMGGIPISSSFTALTAGGWLSEHQQTIAAETKQNQSAAGTVLVDAATKPLANATYTRLRDQVLSKTSITTATSINPAALPADGYYLINNAYELSPTVTIAVGSKKLVYFINGDLTIKDPLGADHQSEITTVASGPSGGFLAFIVNGNIIIDSSVGTKIDLAGMPSASHGIGQTITATKPNLTGIFIAGGELPGKGEIQLPSNSGDTPDKRFIGAGSFIGIKNVLLQRQFNSTTAGFGYYNLLSGYTPVEVFRHRPDFVLNTPSELKESVIQYGEVR